MRRFITLVAALLLSCSALAQRYPDKPVRMIVPFPPGGPLDVVARIYSVKFTERLGQTFLVENRPGAAGNLGMEQVAKSAPDGYTVLWALDAMLAVNPILYKNAPDPLEVMRPVAMVTESPSALVLHPSIEARTPADFVALSKSRELSYASAGSGSPGHRSMEYFKLVTGARLTHVPYKGNAPAIQSLVAGETQAFITPIAGALPHIKSGRLRALAVTTGARTPLLPDVQTMVEFGYPKFKLSAWYALFVPAKTPQAIVETLEREVGRITQLADVREKLSASALEPVWSEGRTVIPRAKEERALWAEVIEKTGMKID